MVKDRLESLESLSLIINKILFEPIKESITWTTQNPDFVVNLLFQEPCVVGGDSLV